MLGFVALLGDRHIGNVTVGKTHIGGIISAVRDVGGTQSRSCYIIPVSGRYGTVSKGKEF